MKDKVKDIFEELFERFPEIESCRKSLASAFDILKTCYKSGKKVLVCGNGGSAADSEHIVGELMKGFLLKRPISEKDREKLRLVFPKDWAYISNNLQRALPAISLISQSAILTAFINDVAADMVFAQQVFAYANEGDVLIALSTSGNSKNVVNAIKVAKAYGVHTIGMTGNNGGEMKQLCDVTLLIPFTQTYRVQEYHLSVYHTLCAMIELEFFDE